MLIQTTHDDYDVRLEKVFRKQYEFLEQLKKHKGLEPNIIKAIVALQKEIDTEIFRGS